jgi:hypothetical protein
MPRYWLWRSQRSIHSLVLKALQQFPKPYEQKGLILHSRNSRGSDNISPASRHRRAHSSRLRYWSNLTTFPNHSSPAELVITTTFGTSQGPTQPLMVSWTRFNSPRFRHSLFSHSTGTSGKPRSTLPQQHPRQIVIWPITRRFVFSGQSRSSFTMSNSPVLLEATQSSSPYKSSISNGFGDLLNHTMTAAITIPTIARAIRTTHARPFRL